MSATVKTVLKPWGREIWYACNRLYVGKILFIKKGHRLSLQYHKRKHETLYTLKGRFILEKGGRKTVLGAGSAFEIPPKTVHRFEARFGPVTLLEVSTPQVSDIVRLADDYGRAGGKNRGRKERR
jgi:mannose-6-phosphate isomerase-like protein (cupin superfamily)